VTEGRRAVRVVVSGRVQGVGFRFTTCDLAAALGLDGWVRNRADGTVEVVAAGPPAAVERLLAFLRRGPAAARVVDTVVVPVTPEVAGSGFRIRR